MHFQKSKNIFLSELNNFEPKIPKFRNVILLNELSNRKYSKKNNKKLLGLSNNISTNENNKKIKNIKRPLTSTTSSNENRNKKKYKTHIPPSHYTSFFTQSNIIKTLNNEENIKKKTISFSNNKKRNEKIKHNIFKKRPFSGIKYPFIIDNHPILPKPFTGLPKEIIEENRKLCESLKIDNEKLFDNSICLIPKKNFSSKFRYPFQEKIIIKSENEILKELGIKKEEEEK